MEIYKIVDFDSEKGYNALVFEDDEVFQRVWLSEEDIKKIKQDERCALVDVRDVLQ